MDLTQLETPALVVDVARLDANVARLREKIGTLGVALRPHVKTCKSIDVARLAMPTTKGPITVSTLKEADYFASHGVTDMLYAVGITPNKLDHVARLMAGGTDLKIVLDSVDAAQAVAERGRALRVRYRSILEIDCDGHRSGIRPEDPVLFDIAGVLRESGAELLGVMTHAGESYHCKSTDEIRTLAEQERRAVVDVAASLRTAGFSIPIVSVGSTPTAMFAATLDGVTEVRAGVYMFFDLVMVGLGVCKVDDIALSVLTSVVGHQKDKGWIITDAGWMAMSRDRGTEKQRIDHGYGMVCDADGRPMDDLIVVDANQEHGIIAARDGTKKADGTRVPVGTLLRILPNHACATGAQHSEYKVVRGSRAIEAVWPRLHG